MGDMMLRLWRALPTEKEYTAHAKIFSAGTGDERIDVYVDLGWWDAQRATLLEVMFMENTGLIPKGVRVPLQLKPGATSRCQYDTVFPDDKRVSTGAYLPLVAFDGAPPTRLIMLLRTDRGR